MDTVEIVNPITAEAEVHTFTLVSDDIYVRRYDASTVPLWYKSLVETIVQNSPYAVSVNSALSSITGIQEGYAVQLVNLETANSSTNALLTTLASTIDGHTAAIGDIQTTYASKTEAAAIATTAVQSYINGGSANAWFTGQISTYAAQTIANAAQINTLSATLGTHTVSIDTLEQISISQGTSLAQLSTDLTTAIGDIQAQLDGSITTWFDDYTPTNANEPWLTWLNTDTLNGNTIEQDKHTGDIFYDTASGYGYRFTKVAGVFNWSVITDNAVTQALTAASTAQATADGKATIYYQAAAPTGLTTNDIGDVWIDSDNNNLTYTWNGTTWLDTSNANTQQALTWSASASKLIKDPNGNITGWQFADGSNTVSTFTVHADVFKVSNSTSGLTPFTISGTDIILNGKVSFGNITDAPNINTTFAQTTAPTTGMTLGDTWIDTDDSNKIYIYSGTAWMEQGAGGSSNFLQASAPTTGMQAGDIWIDSDDNYKQYRYNGTSWVLIAYNPATAINGGTTTIDGGKITTGSVLSNAFFGNVIYNLIWNGTAWVPANDTNYTMKINLATGSIHIK